MSKKKRVLISYPTIALFSFILMHFLCLHFADMPADFCHFHFNKPTFLQGLFLDGNGHPEPYGLEFILICFLMICSGLFMAIWKNIKR